VTFLSDVPWKPIDADDPDMNFLLKWSESGDVKACLKDDIWIVSGEKGSGKSAMKRAIMEKYSSHYSMISTIDFDALTFRPIYENIVGLAQATGISKTMVLSNHLAMLHTF
jgi:hypothetical protein